MTALIIRNIGELCTADPERGEAPGVVRNAALVAIDGVLTFVGAESALQREHVPAGVSEIDAQGMAVLPGFVDAHTHLVWLGDRGNEYAARAAGTSYEDIARAGGGIRATVAATAAGTLDQLVSAARRRARRALHDGTTTLEVKSGYGLDQDAEMRQLEAAAALHADADLPDVVPTYLPLHALPDGERSAFIDSVINDGVPQASSRAPFVDAFCDHAAYSVDECRRVFEAAVQHGMRPKIHAEQRGHIGGAQLAASLHAVSADHLEYADEDDVRALAGAGVTCVLLPGASLVLGGPPPPGRRLLDAGATIAIATDCNPGTCYSESMPVMLSLAVAMAGLTPAEALVAATRGGAAALALRDRGVLRPGWRCDVAILDSPHWVDIAYHLGADTVSRVVIAGLELPL